MPQIPDLTDPRYLDEIGWFLYHEKYRRGQFGGSYNAERLAYSRLLRDEVARYLDTDASWLERKTVVSIGCGCTGDLAAFPAGVKIAIDPLLYIYQTTRNVSRPTKPAVEPSICLSRPKISLCWTTSRIWLSAATLSIICRIRKSH